MAFITWNDGFELGIESIDKQHREMAELVNQIHDDLFAGTADRFVQQAFEKLADYTAAHFRFEEDWFVSTKYPRAEEHRRKHQHLMLLLNRFHQSLDRSGPLIGLVDQLEFLRGWLLDHFEDEDKALVAHLNEKGIR